MTRLLKQQAVGEHLRRLRTRCGLSVRDLAARTGFSPSFISQVENGHASPSINSMELIARAVGVTLGEFFAATAEGRGGQVLKASQRQALQSGWSNATVEMLGKANEALEPVQITLNAGGRSGKHPAGHPSEEFALILEGSVTLTLGPEDHVLEAGDSVTILPGELRVWYNHGTVPARFLLVSSRATGPRSQAGKGRPPRRGARATRPPTEE